MDSDDNKSRSTSPSSVSSEDVRRFKQFKEFREYFNFSKWKNSSQRPNSPNGGNSRSDDPIPEHTFQDGVHNSREMPPETEPPLLCQDLLEAIGAHPVKDTNLAPGLHPDLATCWKELLHVGLPSDSRDQLLKDYPIPKNCTFLVPPLLNKEVAKALPASCGQRDDHIRNRQMALSASISSIGEFLSKCLDSNSVDDKPVIKLLGDAGRLLIDSLREETIIRRYLVLGNIKESMKKALDDTSPGVYLFGDKLGETIKIAKLIDQSAAELKIEKATVPQVPKTGTCPPRGPQPFPAAAARGGQRPKYTRPPYRQMRQSRPRSRSRSHSPYYRNRYSGKSRSYSKR